MTKDKAVDEVLEFIWSQRELGSQSVQQLLGIDEVAEEADINTLVRMMKEGLVDINGDIITLTAHGERLAEGAIRRHRLAERLLCDLLDIERDTVERHACSFEHSLSPAVTDSICTLLGHPPACPHGHPIPKGECCAKKTGELIRPVVMPLSELPPGLSARVVFITHKTFSRIEKLGSMGLVPGCIIRLEQKKPAFVIKTGETTLALDPEIVKEIYVRKVD